MSEKTNVSLSDDTVSVYRPAASAVVSWFVPLTLTFTMGRGCPLTELVTVPLTGCS